MRKGMRGRNEERKKTLTIMHYQPSPQHLNPLQHRNLHKPLLATPRRPQIQPAHVRLALPLQSSPPPHPHRRHLPCLRMTPSQQPPQKGLLDPHPRRRSHNTSLPQPAPERFADPTRAGYESVRADDHAADGRAKALAEAQAHAVEAGAVVGEGARAGGHSFPEARAIEVE